MEVRGGGGGVCGEGGDLVKVEVPGWVGQLSNRRPGGKFMLSNRRPGGKFMRARWIWWGAVNVQYGDEDCALVQECIHRYVVQSIVLSPSAMPLFSESFVCVVKSFFWKFAATQDSSVLGWGQ